jgi:hypothetical protein
MIGPEALEDRPSRPDRVWNRIPDEVRQRIIAMALDARSSARARSPPTDAEDYFVSESSVCRLRWTFIGIGNHPAAG